MASPSTAGPAHRVQSAVEVYGFPWGHLGHLTPQEEETLNNFKALCQENGYYSPGNGDSEPPSHDDATMLSVPFVLFAYLLLTGPGDILEHAASTSKTLGSNSTTPRIGARQRNWISFMRR